VAADLFTFIGPEQPHSLAIWGQIIIEDGYNVQEENCTIHMFQGDRLLQEEPIGHGAVIALRLAKIV
jgi:hypothetical protein